MRDARPQGRKERGPRHDRALARRRGGGPPIDLTGFGEAFGRIAGAIVLDAAAFVVWNVGTRSPLGLLRSIAASVRRPRALLAGTAAALIGLMFVAAAAVLLAPAILDLDRDFIPFELGTLLVALALEQFVGPQVRLFAKRSLG